ncbi:MAG: valine--tRNA ligase [Planctomycetota bacterium]|nr:MAG: valine--tRNA ligase [Planctomycetota bacterium]
MSSLADKIPSRFDFQSMCGELYQQWEKSGCFHAEVNPDKPPFSIVIPPPNVTGALHLGHALNNTLQDIRVRWHRMRGFETLWMPGTDHAGIATQAVVERRLKEDEGKTRHDLGREKLVERIWQWKEEYETRILNQLRQMGCSCDWRRTRFTLDEVCARAVRTTFFDLFAKGLIYRGKRLVNWDTYLQTAVSDDEVFHETIKGHFWYFKYPVIDPQPGEPTHVTIATTRPETMLGDVAVAVHPDPAAALDAWEQQLREKLAAAPAKEKPEIERQLEELLIRRRDLLPRLEQLAAMARRGTKLMLPLLERPIDLICDPWAKPEMGTGCVKITPAHDPNDYEVGLRCHLPMVNILNPDGTLNENAGPYAGLRMAQARQRIVADMEARGLLEKVEDREIDLAHSDRSKTPIEPYLADQWFVKMDTLAQDAMDAVLDGRVKIIPPRYAKGYLDWLSEKRDWPVGRQLWWGHRIPIWTRHFDSPEQAAAEVERIRQLPACQARELAVDTEGEQTVHVCILQEGSPLEAEFEQAGYVQQEDVLDTWFSSALWPHSTLGWPEKTPELEYFYPTSTLITSRDIITLWVARMVLMGLNNTGQVPFHEVYIHPKILDGYGETMSKSKGNGVDPIDVIEKFGPDALRFGLAWLATETQDVRMPVQYECPHCQAAVPQTKQNRQRPTIQCPSCKKLFSTQWAQTEEDRAHPRAPVVSERFEIARNFCNKLWNAARFVMMNLEGFQPIEIDRQELTLADRWILSRLATTTAGVNQALTEYRHADAMRLLYDFAWDEYCSYYVEMAKSRLGDPASRPIAQQVLAHVLDHLLRLLHPVMPFITEAIWQQLAEFGPRRTMEANLATDRWLMMSAWPQADLSWVDEEIEQQFATFARIVGALREIRANQNIPPKEEVAFSIRCSASQAALLEPMIPFFKGLARAECTALGTELPELEVPPAEATVDGMVIRVDLGKFIDIDAELRRNRKLLENIVKQIAGKEAKLKNEKFVQRAPAEVVEKERAALEQLKHQHATVEATLERLAAARK